MACRAKRTRLRVAPAHWWRARRSVLLPAILAQAFVLLLVVSFSSSAEDNPKQLLHNTSRKVKDTVERLPKYVCTQTVTRYRYEHDAGRQNAGVIHPARSCDDLVAEVHADSWKQYLSSSDRLRLDVAVSRDPSGADGEMYSWVGAAHFSASDLFEIVPDGALSSGTFSSMLASIFGGNTARFSYHGDITVAERLLSEFGFRVPQEKSRYSYLFGKDRSQHVIVGYEGTILVDPEAADLVRIAVRTDPLPAESGACELSRRVNYHRVRLNDADFLLPSEAVISIIHADETVAENVVNYSECREFRGESTVHFGDTPGDVAKEPVAVLSAPAPALSPGLPFRLIFTDPINPAIAAAGDPIRAKLKTPIRDRSRILVPEGTVVTARITSIRRFYAMPKSGVLGRKPASSQPSLAMAVRLESLEVGGISRPFKAAFESGLQRFAKLNGPLSVRVDLGSLDTAQEPDSAVFNFWNADPDGVIDSGLESDWVTVAP